MVKKKKAPTYKSLVCIVILNWNQPKLTLDCLKSVRKLRVEGFELKVVVVDNGSTDNSVKLLKEAKRQSADYDLLTNEVNIGFTGGNNVGIKYALKKNADFVLILNNDTEVDKDLLFELLKAAKSNPKAGMFSPKIYFAKGYEFRKERYKKSERGNVIWAVGGSLDRDNVYGTNRGVDQVDKGQFEKPCEVDFASGACVLIRAEALKRVGLFNERYYMYLEDVELSQRMKKLGWQVVYVPCAKLWHKVAQSSSIGGDLNDYFIARNRLLFGLGYARWRTKAALIKESVRILFKGRRWQRKGVIDYYLRRFGSGSWLS